MDSKPPSGAPRIAFVTGGVKLGGSTTFLINLAGELVRRKIPVEVLSFESENPLASDFRRLEIPVCCQDDRRIIFEDRLMVILAALRRFEPTVVIANLSAISFEVLRYLPEGVFRIGMVHSDDPAVYRMVSFYGRQVDLMAGVSDTIRLNLEKMPEFAQVPVAYLPYGVAIPARVTHQPRASAPLRILYFGRLSREQKRVHLFPEILAGLKRAAIPFQWTIAGDGPDQAWLRQNMPAGENQTLSFTGPVSYSAVPDLLADHDIYLLASNYEGLPLSLLEAMGSGLVPVISDLKSGIGEVVDETNGKRVSPDDVEGYARAIAWLHQHRAELSELSANARQRVKRDFSVEAMTDRWLNRLPANPPRPTWPAHWFPQAPLTLGPGFRFTLAGRMLRRVLLRMRRIA